MTDFALGDTVMIRRPRCGLWLFWNLVQKRERVHHQPWIEGTVTAIGTNLVRVAWGRRQKWFATDDPYLTITKVRFAD